MFLILGSIVIGLAQGLQEVVYLKNGSIIRGIIIEQVPNESLKIQTNDGNIFAYNMSEVEKITKEPPIMRGKQSRGISIFDGNGVQQGYRGFVEIGYTVGTGDWGTGRVDFSTSHGYQFNPYFYAGLGMGVSYFHYEDLVEIPVFVDLRSDILNNWVTPYVDFKIGCAVYDNSGFYMSPSVGCRFNLNNIGLNVGIGYTMQKLDYYSRYYYDKVNCGGFSIKLSIDF